MILLRTIRALAARDGDWRSVGWPVIGRVIRPRSGLVFKPPGGAACGWTGEQLGASDRPVLPTTCLAHGRQRERRYVAFAAGFNPKDLVYPLSRKRECMASESVSAFMVGSIQVGRPQRCLIRSQTLLNQPRISARSRCNPGSHATTALALHAKAHAGYSRTEIGLQRNSPPLANGPRFMC